MNNMETRNVTLTLDKAKEFYKSGNVALKEIALQAFTECELNPFDFRSITTMNDVLDALGLPQPIYEHMLGHLKYHSKSVANFYKVGLIRQALNKGLNMDFINGNIYYPQIKFVTKPNHYYDEELQSGHMIFVGTIKHSCGKCYDVLGGDARCGSLSGLGNFFSKEGIGTCSVDIGLFGCASREIAEHMSKHFAKEIFDAMYRDFVDYKWV